MKYAVITEGVEKYLDQIIRLGDMNRNRLGLLPKEAFRQFAAQNTIYCIVKDNIVVAYVLFRVRKRSNIIVLTHLCVDSCNRSLGYAKKLVDAVQVQYPNVRCIEVRCRRDYNLDKFWNACGFHVIDERAGRKKSGSTLTIWHRDVNQYDLLYLLHQEETQNKLLVTLDTNIVIDLFQSGPISDYLYDDYLEDYVAYRITPEVMDEVNRNKHDQTRKRTLDFCKRFQSVIIKDGFDQLVCELSSQFDPNNNHTRDIRHLAYSILADADVFITKDEWVCKLTNQMELKYNLLIMEPENLFLYVDYIFEKQFLIPRQICGSHFRIEPLRMENVDVFYGMYEAFNIKKNEFKMQTHPLITDKDIMVSVVFHDESAIGYFAIKNEPYHEIVSFSFSRKKLSKHVRNMLMRYVLNSIVKACVPSPGDTAAIIVRNAELDDMVGVFTECGFARCNHGMVRFAINNVMDTEGVCEKIIELTDSLSETMEDNDSKQIKSAMLAIAHRNPLQLEKILSPLLIKGINIPTYTVPVKPDYAAKLFDEELLSQTYLDNPYQDASLSIENSYFTASKCKFLCPCRIVWYVSEDCRYCNTKAIRSYSVMTECEAGTVKEIYKRHQKYGVLSWSELAALLSRKPEQRIQAFIFENVRAFPKAMSYSKLNDLSFSMTGKKIQLNGPSRIDQLLFEKILDYCVGE